MDLGNQGRWAGAVAAVKDVPGYPGYAVTRYGRILGPRGWRKLQTVHNGHLYVLVSIPGSKRKRTLYAHRAVLLAYVGPCPEGMEGCHKDGDPTNNSVDNLRWGTRSSNIRDRVPHDTAGELNGRAKLTEDDVMAIRALLADGTLKQDEIGRKFGVGQAVISKIKLGKSWSHV